jgi:ankyrin repeat protein
MVSGMAASDALETAVLAVKAGDVASLQQLLAATPELLSARDTAGHTLLNLACKVATGDVALPPVSGTPEQHQAVDCILAAGADPSAAANDGWAPLHAAAMTGHGDLARRLLAAGASRDGRLLNVAGGSPLALALHYGKRDVAEVLATPAVPDNLRHAAALGRPLERFFNGSVVTSEARVGCEFFRPSLGFPEWPRSFSQQELLDEALTWSARNGRIESLEALVARGADVNANPYRGTALLWATYADERDAAAWLLDHGADPDLRHDFGGSQHGKAAVAMHLAAQFSCLKVLRLLLERGARADIEDAAFHATPRGWAQYENATASLELLDEFCA